MEPLPVAGTCYGCLTERAKAAIEFHSHAALRVTGLHYSPDQLELSESLKREILRQLKVYFVLRQVLVVVFNEQRCGNEHNLNSPGHFLDNLIVIGYVHTSDIKLPVADWLITIVLSAHTIQ